MQEVFLTVGFSLLSMVMFIGSVHSARTARREMRKAQHALDELVLVHQSLDTLRTAIKRTEGRLIKSDQRANPAKGDGEPDPKVEPERWKQWQNRRIATRGTIQ